MELPSGQGTAIAQVSRDKTVWARLRAGSVKSPQSAWVVTCKLAPCVRCQKLQASFSRLLEAYWRGGRNSGGFLQVQLASSSPLLLPPLADLVALGKVGVHTANRTVQTDGHYSER